MKTLFIISAFLLTLTASAQKVNVTYVTDAVNKSKQEAKKAAGDSARKYAAQYTAPLSKAQKELAEALADSMAKIPLYIPNEKLTVKKDAAGRSYYQLSYKPDTATVKVWVSTDGELYHRLGKGFTAYSTGRLTTEKLYEFPVLVEYFRQ